MIYDVVSQNLTFPKFIFFLDKNGILMLMPFFDVLDGQSASNSSTERVIAS